MKNAASKLEHIADTMSRRDFLNLDATNDTIIHYLATAEQDALTRARHISPEVADVKAHPLPAWQDLIATPVSRRTLAQVTDEITDYLGDEYRLAASGMMHGLEDFLTWYQGIFLEALRSLTEKKVATAETLGKTNAKKKLVEAFAALPSFPSPEAFEDYCQRTLKRDGADPTDEIIQQWRIGKPTHFPSPEAFKTAFGLALMLDAEATAEINGEGQTAVSCGYTDDVLATIKQMSCDVAVLTNKTIVTRKKQRANGRKHGQNIRDYNEINKDPNKEKELTNAVERDKKDYPDISKERTKGYWKDLWQAAPSFTSSEALRKAVIRKRKEPRGKYPREGKKRGPYNKKW